MSTTPTACRRAARLAPPLLLLALMGAGSTAALAQSTGNPKGGGPLPSEQAPKPPATRAPTEAAAGGAASNGKLDSSAGPAEARLAPSQPPGTGTAGGLPKRNVRDGRDAGPEQPRTRQPSPPAK